MAVISLMNKKGGVGKTTSTLNLAVQASRLGKTLVVDCDEQANLTRQYITEPQKETVKNLFLGKPVMPLEVKKNLFLIPSSSDMAGLENIVRDEYSRERLLKDGLADVAKGFDHVFLDCPPSIGLVTVNVLVASDYVIIPIKAALFSIEGIEGMIDFTALIKSRLNPKLTILGVLVTQYNERLTVAKSIMEEMRSRGWGDDVFKTMIRRNTAIEKSQFKRMDIFDFDKKSNAANDYARLGQEVQKRMERYELKTA